MWKSVGSPQRACDFVTSTGMPRAAHTLLKFTPAAIVATRTSLGPSSGTSSTSSTIASVGSPNRSGRTVIACIRAGTSPTGGSSPMSYRSFATVLTLLAIRRMRHPSKPPGGAARLASEPGLA